MTQIKVVDYQSADAPEQFSKSLRETGFGVIANHPVDQELINRNYALWHEFFQSEDKHNYEFDPKTHTGFISTELSETAKGNDIKDLKEFYHLYASSKCPAKLEDSSRSVMSQLSNLGRELLSWVQDNTPDTITNKFESPLPEMIKESPLHLLRVIHYPPLTGNEPEGAVRAAAHGDINFLTMLPAATAEGLQAMNTDGEWVDVPIDPNWIVVNAGDMLEECTGSYYPSTQHRVTNPTGEAANEPRLSMPLFLHPRDEVRLSDRHTAHSYRLERYAELGLDLVAD